MLILINGNSKFKKVNYAAVVLSFRHFDLQRLEIVSDLLYGNDDPVELFSKISGKKVVRL